MDRAWELFEAGGPVMWPLLVCSIATVAILLERGWYWLTSVRRRVDAGLARAARACRSGDRAAVRGSAADLPPTLASLARALAAFEVAPADDEVRLVTERATARWSATLSLIASASPLLGILGTVLGIIESFDVLGGSAGVTELSAVAAGISEALVTTAAGLVVALLALGPALLFAALGRAQLARAEVLLTAASLGGLVVSGPRSEPTVRPDESS